MEHAKRNAPKMPIDHPAQSLLGAIWGPFDDKGFGEVRAFPKAKSSTSSVRQGWFDDMAGAFEFAAPVMNGERGTDTYFGVARRKREGGTKKDLLGVSCLWADIDTVNAGWDTDVCMRRIADLPGSLQPGAMIKSGGGLHAYWFLKVPILFDDNDGRKLAEVEAANAAMAKLLSGDNVGNADRVLRLPGSWNCKRGNRCETVYCWPDARCTLAALVAAAEKHGPVFAGPAFPKPVSSDASKPKRKVGRVSFGYRSNLDELWAKYVKYHASQEPYVGVNLAIAKTTATLHMRGLDDDVVISATLGCVRKVQAEQAPHEQWNWEEERQRVAKSLDRFKRMKAAEKSAA